MEDMYRNLCLFLLCFPVMNLASNGTLDVQKPTILNLSYEKAPVISKENVELFEENVNKWITLIHQIQRRDSGHNLDTGDTRMASQDLKSSHERSQNEEHENRKYYFIGGGVLILIIIFIIIFCCCCRKRRKTERISSTIGKLNTDSQETSQRPVQLQPLELKIDNLPATQPDKLERRKSPPLPIPLTPIPLNITPHKERHDSGVSQTSNPEVSHQKDFIKSKESLHDQNTDKDKPKPPTRHYSSKVQSYGNTASPDMSESSSKMKKASSYDKYGHHSDGHNKGEFEYPDSPNLKTGYTDKSISELDTHVGQLDSKTEHTDLKHKIESIESTMATIESNLYKLKHITRDIESDLDLDRNRSEQENSQQLRRYGSFHQKSSYVRDIDPQTRFNRSRYRASLRHERVPYGMENKKYIEPYSREVRMELQYAINRKHSLNKDQHQREIKDNVSGQAAYESELNLLPTTPPHANREDIWQGKDRPISSNVIPEIHTSREKHMAPSTIIEEEIIIPDPDYIKPHDTKTSEDAASKDPRPVIPPKPAVKPREFKGPYGIEDLDDMNNPLTIAMRSRNRRSMIGSSGSE